MTDRVRLLLEDGTVLAEGRGNPCPRMEREIEACGHRDAIEAAIEAATAIAASIPDPLEDWIRRYWAEYSTGLKGSWNTVVKL